jgi:circadian clock protein KaiC
MVGVFGKNKDSKGKKYSCIICQKELPGMEELVKHEASHLKENKGKAAELLAGSSKKLVSEDDGRPKPKKLEYIKTGIPGFDEMMDKGIPVGSSVLVSGGPGSGKTIFCLHMANYFAKNKQKCLYMSFEENVERLKLHMKDFGWDPEKLIKDGYFVIRQFDPFEVVKTIEAMVEESKGELLIKTPPIKFMQEFQPKIVMLDSLSAVAAAFSGHENSYRLYISQLFRYFNQIGVNSFLITETEEIPTEITRRGCEEFLADGVVLLYNLKKTSVRVSALEILKMRGSRHQKRMVPMQIMDGKGIVIYPKQDVFEALET